MALNIKNEEVCRAAVQLAELTGLSITEAVGSAVRTRLAEVRRQKNREDLTEQLRAIGRRCRDEAPPDWLRRDYDEDLYDENGLPR